MRARREAPDWKQWNNTWSDDFASTAGYFPAGQLVDLVVTPGPIYGGPFSMSFPADQGSLTIAGGPPSPIQFANLMVGNTITLRKLSFLFSFKYIPVDDIILPGTNANNNLRQMQLNQQIGVRMVFCRFKNMNQASVNAYDPIANLFDSYSTAIPNPSIFDQGTAMIGSC
ncbi:MAG: hypothetical protein LBU84_11805 [Prevotella sp.]|jgi:hypothetical protein|nr:hypothetical protein [Prevotella sp.]